MNKTVTVVQGLLTVMQEQERGGTRSPDEHAKFLSTVDEAILGAQLYAVGVMGPESDVVKTLLDAMQMQQRREREELHLTAEQALPIWNSAKLAGEAYVIAQTPGYVLDFGTQTKDEVRGVGPSAGGTDLRPALAAALANAASFQIGGVRNLYEAVAVKYLKQRAESMARGLQQFGVNIKHGQALRVLASMEGHTSFASLRQALDKYAPNFCPHCGAAGTLKKVDTVFCEQGKYDGKSYEAEGEGVQYACTRCSGQFTDWSGV